MTSGRPEFQSKRSDPRSRVSFSADTHILPNAPRKEVPPRPLAIPSSQHFQRRASFPSKSASQGTPRRDPFASGIRSRPLAPSSEPRTFQRHVCIPSMNIFGLIMKTKVATFKHPSGAAFAISKWYVTLHSTPLVAQR